MGIFDSLKGKFSQSPRVKEQPFLSEYDTVADISVHGASGLFRARHRATGETRVIKKLIPRDPQSLKKINRELELSFEMEHPNIVRYFSFERKENAYYILMEFVKGESLRQFLRKKLMSEEGEPPFVGEKHFLKVYLESAQALQYIHSKRVLHLDIKPENVIVDDEMNAKILDFGISLRGEVTPGHLGGSVFYIAPEVVRAALGKTSSEVGERSDVYSLGATMYELATGRPAHLPSFFDNRIKPWVFYWNEYLKLPDMARKAYEVELMTEGIRESPTFTGYRYSEGARKVLARSLEVATQSRYSHMYEVVRDLKSAGAQA